MRPQHRNPDHGALERLGVRFSATVPITNGMMASSQSFAPVGSPTAEGPPVAIPVAGMEHSTNLHVGAMLLGAGAVILLFHLGGFRLAFDVGMGRG
jgi:hypothetical protein